MRKVHDPVHEGITLACAGMRDVMRERALSELDALLVCVDEFNEWVFSPYGEDADAVRDACLSQIIAMLRETESRARPLAFR